MKPQNTDECQKKTGKLEMCRSQRVNEVDSGSQYRRNDTVDTQCSMNRNNRRFSYNSTAYSQKLPAWRKDMRINIS